MRLIGDRAIDSLRLEKAYGIWSAEFTQAYTPGMSGLDRFVDFTRATSSDVMRRSSARDGQPDARLVLLDIDATKADAAGDEGVWLDGQPGGLHDLRCLRPPREEEPGACLCRHRVRGGRRSSAKPQNLVVDIVGEPRPARILAEPPYDPTGSRLRS